MTNRLPLSFDGLETIPASEDYQQGDKLYRLKDVSAMLGLTWEEVNRVDGLIDAVLGDDLLFVSLDSEDGPEIFVTVAGLCHMALLAKTDVADTFRRWMAIEVLPSIVATGGYINAGLHEDTGALAARLTATTTWALRRAIAEERQGQPLYLPI